MPTTTKEERGSSGGSNLTSTELKHAMFIALVEELENSKQMDAASSKFLKDQYQKMFEEVYAYQLDEVNLTRRCNTISSDILSEQITLEKDKLKEVDEEKELAKLNDVCESVQIELEFSEQKDLIAKFELAELQKAHEELVETLKKNQQENANSVEPVLSSLKKDLNDIVDQLKKGEDALARDEKHKEGLLKRLLELEGIEYKKADELKELHEHAIKAENEPIRLKRQTETTQKALESMNEELNELNGRLRGYDEEFARQEKKRQEAEKLKRTLLEKNELHRQTLAQRQQDSAIVKIDVENERQRAHDFATRNVEIGILKKDAENQLQSLNDQQSIVQKEYENLKRIVKKKRSIVDAIRAVLPRLEEILNDQEVSLKSYEAEVAEVKQDVLHLKKDLDEHIVEFLQLEGVQADRKQELEELIEEVDGLEADVLRCLIEEKRLNKLLHALTSQRDLKFRENTRLENKEKQAHYQVKMRQLVILDLTKRCSELSNRLKEFSALYEVVKNERNKYVNLIQISTQALAEMREKIRILQNEVEILGQEFSTKDKALSKERAAHLNARNQRDSIRQDMSKLLYDYRSKQGVIEQQVLEIDKLNTVINILEKDMIDLKVKYEQAIKDRNAIGVHLIDCNDELCVLYERSNLHLQSIHNGTVEFANKENEMRLARLQVEELLRQYKAAEKRVPQVEIIRTRIRALEEDVARSRIELDQLSDKLENPANVERWRPLAGEDLDVSMLEDKISLLEVRINEKRSQLLEKDLILEEVSSLTTKLHAQATAKRDVAKNLTDQLNELQCRIRDTTKSMLAAVSELSMYQASALRLQQEKSSREEVLVKATTSLENGEPPTEEAVKDLYRMEKKRELFMETLQRKQEAERTANMRPMYSSKTTAEPRPTAYVPDDELGIPKPYGRTAPFKPTEAGATMRHIRVPIVKDIEI